MSKLHVPFFEAVEDATGGNPKLQTSDYQPAGRFPIIDQGQEFIVGYTDDESALCNRAGDVIIFGDHTKTFKFIDFDFVLGADGVKVLRAKSGFDARYLFQYLKTVRLPENLGYSRHFKYLKECVVPKPSLEEQKRIAAILDKADSLRRQRQQAVCLADDFIHAVFLDMFGDPIGKDGNRVSLAKVIDIDAPMVDPRLDEYADMLHVGPDRIEKDTGRLLECQTAREEGLISKKFLFDDSYVLYSKIRPYFRKCALATFTGLCSADMYPVRPKVGVATREFIWALLLSNEFDRYVASLPDRANIPKLNRDELNAFEFNLPSIQKQEKFSAIVQKRIAYTNLLDCSCSNALRLANSLQALFL